MFPYPTSLRVINMENFDAIEDAQTYRDITASLEEALKHITDAQHCAAAGFGPIDPRTQEMVDTYAAVYGALIRFRSPALPPPPCPVPHLWPHRNKSDKRINASRRSTAA